MSSGVDIAYNDCTHGAASHEQVAQIHVFGGANTLGVCEDSSGEGKDKASGRRGVVRVGGGLPVATSRAAAREGVTWEVAGQSKV